MKIHRGLYSSGISLSGYVVRLSSDAPHTPTSDRCTVGERTAVVTCWVTLDELVYTTQYL
jgi:hypothetical protein